MVRHNQQEIKFDFSENSQRIQWAAFYSDCEHEVLPVTSGYRVTLTYNLYLTQTDPIKSIQSSSFPLYEDFSKALRSKNFLPTGSPSFWVSHDRWCPWNVLFPRLRSCQHYRESATSGDYERVGCSRLDHLRNIQSSCCCSSCLSTR